ncbi:hypothetical protein ACFFJY_14730 [Fictibacillus aquaticus]|nr:hypothetical protein [Fictibacillus aquaticus]
MHTSIHNEPLTKKPVTLLPIHTAAIIAKPSVIKEEAKQPEYKTTFLNPN